MRFHKQQRLTGKVTVTQKQLDMSAGVSQAEVASTLTVQYTAALKPAIAAMSESLSIHSRAKSNKRGEVRKREMKTRREWLKIPGERFGSLPSLLA